MGREYALQFKVWLWGIEPQIWRRFVFSPDISFAELHEVMQGAFGWKDTHMHQFTVGGFVVGAPEFEDGGLSGRQVFDAEKIYLRDLDFHRLSKPSFLYEYDFGDGWVHQFDLETHVQHDRPETRAFLMDGSRSGPPEDCGGPHSYEEFVLSLGDKTHPEHQSNKRWVGKSFDPEVFDPIKSRRVVDRALKRCQGTYRFRLERTDPV